jgi:hypothetical protein
MGKGGGEAGGTVSVARKDTKHVLCDSYVRGVKKEPRRGEPHWLREVEEARSRRWDKVVRADWRANSIVKKVWETIEAR